MFSDEINYIKDYFGGEKFKKSNLTEYSTSIGPEEIGSRVVLNWVSGSFPNMSNFLKSLSQGQYKSLKIKF